MQEHVRALKRRFVATLLGLGLVVGVGAAVIATLIDTIDVRHQQVAYEAAERMAAAELLASAQQERSSNTRGYLLTGTPRSSSDDAPHARSSRRSWSICSAWVVMRPSSAI
jgi:CHASE3 domain sensor protein